MLRLFAQAACRNSRWSYRLKQIFSSPAVRRGRRPKHSTLEKPCRRNILLSIPHEAANGGIHATSYNIEALDDRKIHPAKRRRKQGCRSSTKKSKKQKAIIYAN
jgi:hypothetical protein